MRIEILSLPGKADKSKSSGINPVIATTLPSYLSVILLNIYEITTTMTIHYCTRTQASSKMVAAEEAKGS